MVILVSILLLVLAAWLQARYNLFTPTVDGLRVLMYHKLDPVTGDFLTVKVSEFEKQLKYLIDHKYHFLSLSDLLVLLDDDKPFPSKSVILTFDDGYQNNFEYLLPILKKYQLKAAIFLPVSYIGKTNEWDKGSDTLMDYATLKKAQPFFEYGLHSFAHLNMAKMTLEEFEQDLSTCMHELQKNKLDFFPALAYPYGRFPKERLLQASMKKIGIKAVFRIGNKVNTWPLKKKKYLIKRIDIKGTDSFWEFRTKVTKGRVRMF